MSDQIDFIGRGPDQRDHCINPLGAPKYGGYAHFPGTGPQNTHCRSCLHKKTLSKNTYCLKWVELKKFRGPLAKAPSIDSASPSCKYYEERGKP